MAAKPDEGGSSRLQMDGPSAELVEQLNDKASLTSPKSAVIMEVIASERNLRAAFQEVKENNGAPGIDRQSVEEVSHRLSELIPELSKALQEETYRPGAVRRVWIPKSGGGQRGLGIPNVVDRMVQQAVYRVMLPFYDPTFHESSHGFRPNRSCHTAIMEAKKHIEDGYQYVVDIDLEKFFDTVNHARLMSSLRQRLTDEPVLRLIYRMLKSRTVMPDGVIVANEEGVPQGGPLSPLLSNIVLDELDRELSKRGHRFVRYADDCNIYVRSERAGYRVMESVSRFIERRLRLKVNKAKSAISRTGGRHFLGFTLKVDESTSEVQIHLSERTHTRIKEKIRELTPRNWGSSMEKCIKRLNRYLIGWIGFFRICSEPELTRLMKYDAHIRRRLRAMKLKQWKRKRIRAVALIKLGIRARTAWRCVYDGKKSLWRLSHAPIVDRALNNARFALLGLKSLKRMWEEHHSQITVPC